MIPFAFVVFQGHKLKNPKMQLVQKVKEVPAALRIIISGTPIQNNLMEMHALFDIACPVSVVNQAQSYKDPVFCTSVLARADLYS